MASILWSTLLIIICSVIIGQIPATESIELILNKTEWELELMTSHDDTTANITAVDTAADSPHHDSCYVSSQPQQQNSNTSVSTAISVPAVVTVVSLIAHAIAWRYWLWLGMYIDYTNLIKVCPIFLFPWYFSELRDQGNFQCQKTWEMTQI